MFKKILLGISALLLVLLIAGFAILYRGDLSREDLADTYISESSAFMNLPNGATMHYRDEGNPSGPALVMVHGGFGSLHNFEGWIEPLSENFRLISMDLLGHGLTGKYPDNVYDRYTERDAIHQLMQQLEIDRYAVAGNSFGGGIAIELALEYPEEVEALILIDSEGVPNGEDGYDTSLFSDDGAVSPDRPEFRALSWYEDLGSKLIGPTVISGVLHSLTYNKDLLTDEYVDYFGRILRYEGNREAQLLMFRQGMYLISQNDKMDLLPRLSEISAPTLVMHGEQDTLVPMRVANLFNENIPVSELAIVENAGHMPMIEKPIETAAMVSAFFEKYEIGKD